MVVPLLQRQPAEPEEGEDGDSAEQAGERRARRAGTQASPGSPGSFAGRLRRAQSGGEPLPAQMRASMEIAFGASFQAVRIHSDTDAAQLSDTIGAAAFTHGTHIFLGANRLDRQGQHGGRLLAHELTHVVQQNPEVTVPGPAPRQVPAGVLQRDEKPGAERGKANRDDPADVVEAVVHMMSNRGLWGDVGKMGEKLGSPLYATEVTKTVVEPEHVELLKLWYFMAVGDPSTYGNSSLIADARARTDPLVVAMKAGARSRKRAAALAASYAAGLEQLSQRAAREEVGEEIGAREAAAAKAQSWLGISSEDDQLRVGVDQARKLLKELPSLSRKLASAYTSAKLYDAINKKLSGGPYEDQLRTYLRRVFAEGEFADAPEGISRASAMNFADGIHPVKGGLDGISAILAVTDPKKREALLRQRANIYGSFARSAEINAVLWKFISGSIAFSGAGVWGMAKLAGKTLLAEKVLDATVRGVANVGTVLNVVGVIHGVAVLIDPDATADQKVDPAVETASSGIGLAGFASRWFPRLAWASRWSGPVAASLAINLAQFRYLAHLRYRTEIGLNRMGWSYAYQVTEAVAHQVQKTQRQLVATASLLAAETEPRRAGRLCRHLSQHLGRGADQAVRRPAAGYAKQGRRSRLERPSPEPALSTDGSAARVGGGHRRGGDDRCRHLPRHRGQGLPRVGFDRNGA